MHAVAFLLDKGLIASLPIRRAITILTKNYPEVKVTRQGDTIAWLRCLKLYHDPNFKAGGRSLGVYDHRWNTAGNVVTVVKNIGQVV